MRRALCRAAAGAGAAACLAATAGCGGGGLPRQLTPGQRADLHTLVVQARAAAGAGDLPATHAALERLKGRVRTLRDSGALADGATADLLKHIALADLKAAHTVAPAAPAAPPASPAAPAVTPPAAPAAPAGGAGKQKKDKGHGRGNGAGKDG